MCSTKGLRMSPSSRKRQVDCSCTLKRGQRLYAVNLSEHNRQNTRILNEHTPVAEDSLRARPRSHPPRWENSQLDTWPKRRGSRGQSRKPKYPFGCLEVFPGHPNICMRQRIVVNYTNQHMENDRIPCKTMSLLLGCVFHEAHTYCLHIGPLAVRS